MARGYRFGVVGSISTVPDGSTVLPTDDISIWLECAGRRETYTTLAQVLADLTCLGALISNENAVDYLVRSKTFAKTFGALVPKMTSNTTPSGQCGASSSNSDAYKAFDDNSSTDWSATTTTNQWIKYTFATAVVIRKVTLIPTYSSSGRVKNFKISGSNDGTNWTDLYTGVAENRDYTDSPLVAEFENNVAYTQYRLYVTDEYGSGNMYIRVSEIQLYSAEGLCVDSNAMTLIGGNNYCANTLLADSNWREAICNSPYFESVLNAKVPKMTGNTTPSGEAFSNAVYNNKQPYLAFDDDSTTYSTYTGVVNGYTGYHFTEDVSIYKAIIYPQADMTGETFYIQESSDGTNYSNISSALDSLTVASHTILCNPSNIKKAYCRITNTTRNKTYGGYSMYTIQFYGRKDI